jgi:hypothetical protein
MKISVPKSDPRNQKIGHFLGCKFGPEIGSEKSKNRNFSRDPNISRFLKKIGPEIGSQKPRKSEVFSDENLGPEIGPEKSRKSEVFSDENLGPEIGPEKSKNRKVSRKKFYRGKLLNPRNDVVYLLLDEF